MLLDEVFLELGGQRVELVWMLVAIASPYLVAGGEQWTEAHLSVVQVGVAYLIYFHYLGYDCGLYLDELAQLYDFRCLLPHGDGRELEI